MNAHSSFWGQKGRKREEMIDQSRPLSTYLGKGRGGCRIEEEIGADGFTGGMASKHKHKKNKQTFHVRKNGWK